MKLRIAVQKSGRLYEDSIRILKECGIGFTNGLNKLKVDAYNFPVELFFFRDDDIPQYVQDGVADIGIVGQNILKEQRSRVRSVLPLGFGKCKLAIAVPKDANWKGIASLRGKRIATSYPGILGEYLKKSNVRAEIHTISGSVEIAPGIGLSDAICDLVSSGSTLFTNGLREVETVMMSEAVLVANSKLNKTKLEVLSKLVFRINALKQAGNNKYILLNSPDDKLEQICRILPGMKSPTILPLHKKGWSSVHSVVKEDEFWEIIEQLKENGAQGILVVPIEKMIL